jgi:glycosyltransferase involved in cell wall biosynthesis
VTGWGEINDREAAVGKSNTRFGVRPNAFIVRTTMGEAANHLPNDCGLRRSAADQSRDAAHPTQPFDHQMPIAPPATRPRIEAPEVPIEYSLEGTFLAQFFLIIKTLAKPAEAGAPESIQVQRMSKHVYLFMGQFGAVGGIETMCVKLMNELLKRDHIVLAARSEGELTHLLNPAVQIVGTMDNDQLVDAIERLKIETGESDDRPAIKIVSMHPWDLARAALLNRSLSRRGYAVSGFHLVTHSRAFFFDSRFPVMRRLLRRIFFSSPRSSTYFMNVAARDAHQAFWRVPLSNYPILALPISRPASEWKNRNGPGLRIVSVGRLVPFKGYNRAAPAVTRSLRDSGIDVTWHIWGDGDDEPNVSRAIKKAGIEQHVTLKGSLPYEQFDNIVAGYDLFVGMGTALLEAARLRMPAITSVEGAEFDTYGFLSETPLDSVGDKVPGAPIRSLEEVIRSYTASTPSEIEATANECRVSAMKRSNSIGDLANAVERAAPWEFRRSHAIWLSLASVVLAVFDRRKAAWSQSVQLAS